MGYAFISYSSKNQSAADALRDLMNKRGIETWMAPGDIPVGSSYMKEINHALKECSCLVLLLSNAAQDSQWVIKEVERAINYRKPVIPVQIEEVILNDEFEFVLGSYQVVAVQKIDRDSDAVKRVIKSVAAATGITETEISPAGEPAVSNFETSKIDIPPMPGPVIKMPENNAGAYVSPQPDRDLRAIKEPAQLRVLYPGYSDIRYVSGGFAARVYRATDNKSNMEIAIKTYSVYDAFSIPLFSNDSLFFNIKSLSNENICKIINRNLYEPSCIVSEYIQGQTLEAFNEDPFTFALESEVSYLKILLGILNGLKALHERNIYYGDLTPRNIIIDNNKKAWLCDFSESNYNGSRCPDKTVLFERYRSPERCGLGTVDFRSDIYEFGMILSDFLLYFMHDAKADKVLSEIFIKSTKKTPEERYQSVNEIIPKIAQLLP